MSQGMIRESKKFPDIVIEQATAKLDSFRNLKGEIDTDMMQIFERLEAVEKKIRDNCVSKEKPWNVLMQPEADYIECLKMQHEKLEQFFR